MPKMPPGAANAAAAGGPLLARVALLGGAVVYGLANSIFNVEGGHRAIVFNRVVGVKDEVFAEGTHFMLPWFERPIIYDVRARPNVIQTTPDAVQAAGDVPHAWNGLGRASVAEYYSGDVEERDCAV